MMSTETWELFFAGDGVGVGVGIVRTQEVEQGAPQRPRLIAGDWSSCGSSSQGPAERGPLSSRPVGC